MTPINLELQLKPVISHFQGVYGETRLDIIDDVRDYFSLVSYGSGLYLLKISSDAKRFERNDEFDIRVKASIAYVKHS